MTQCTRPSTPRAICDVIGSAASAVTFVDSARTSSACAVNRPNCLRQKACPFRKFHPAWIRIIRQNHRILGSDVCDPATL